MQDLVSHAPRRVYERLNELGYPTSISGAARVVGWARRYTEIRPLLDLLDQPHVSDTDINRVTGYMETISRLEDAVSHKPEGRRRERPLTQAELGL